MAAANVPCADASTCGLAYSRDPDELSAADRFSVKPADADTQAAVLEPIAHDGAGPTHHRAVPWPPISFSSAVAATLVVGGVSVAMLVAANVAGTANRGAVAAEAADSSALLPAMPVASPAPAIPAATVLPVPQQLPVAPPVPQPAPAPTLPKPAVQERAPLVQVRQPVPSRVITEPAPVAVEKPLQAPPIAVDPEPVEALPAPAPALALPPPVFTAPSPAVSAPPIYPAPGCEPRIATACRNVAVDTTVVEVRYTTVRTTNATCPMAATILAGSTNQSLASAARIAAAADASTSAVDACADPAVDAIPCPAMDSGAGRSAMDAGPVVAIATGSGHVSFAVPVPVPDVA